jgi:hypothetical protein
MKTYWCSKKISIVDWINKGVDFDIALLPCKKSECPEWLDGDCINLTVAGNKLFESASHSI